MKKNGVILTYVLLSLFLIGSAVLLGLQVKHYLYERTDPLVDIRKNEVNEEEIKVELEQNQQQDRRDTLLVFNQTKSFEALATPVPRPTSTPLPPPSPTPITPGKNWTYVFATSSSVMLKKYDGTSVMAKVGDVVSDNVFGAFEVVGIEGDFAGRRIKIKHVDSGTIGWITTKSN